MYISENSPSEKYCGVVIPFDRGFIFVGNGNSINNTKAL